MRVLYVNHTAEMSGGERSLLYLLSVLPPSVAASVACPPGPLALAVRQLGLVASEIPPIKGSLRFHPWHTARGLVAITEAALAIHRRALATDADLVHANSIRAGLAAALAAKLGGPPVIVDVRDCLPMTRMAKITRRFLGKHAAAIFANSSYTATNFGGCRAVVRVVHNAIDLKRFDFARFGRNEARDRLGIDRSASVLGLVAQITPWKGQEEAIRALALIRSRRPTQLLLVGEAKFRGGQARFDTYAYRNSLRRIVQDLGLDGAVHFLGERRDIPEILRALDLLLMPSWEEPFGNVALEAMAMEIPVVASDVGGLVEIVRPGEDGLLLPPKQPEAWAAAIEELLAQTHLRARMGRNGRQRVEMEFDGSRYLGQVLAYYHAAVGESLTARELKRVSRPRQ